MNRYTLSVSLLLGLCLVLGSCGGAPSDSDSGGGGPITVTITATPGLDGYVRSDGVVETSGASSVTGDVDAVANGVGARQFFSFDISGIPDTATIVYVTACWHQTSCVGTPYTTHGFMRFEHVVYGPTLDAADYDVPTLHDEGGLSVPSNAQESGRCLAVTASVAADLAGGSGRAQFRTKFQTFDSDADDVTDNVHFAEAEDANPIARPTIEVTYQP